jgi:hypothetical protein
MGTTLTLVGTATSGRAAPQGTCSAGFGGMPGHSITGAAACRPGVCVFRRGIAVPDASLAAPSGWVSP